MPHFYSADNNIFIAGMLIKMKTNTGFPPSWSKNDAYDFQIPWLQFIIMVLWDRHIINPALQERSGDSKKWSHPPKAANNTESQNLKHTPSTQAISFHWGSYYQETNAEFTCRVGPDCDGQQSVHGFINLSTAERPRCACPSYPSIPGKLPGKLSIVTGSKGVVL